MITSIHTMIYSDDADATRIFLRDVLQWPYADAGYSDGETGWLIFRCGPSEMGIHPTRSEWEGKVYTHEKHQEISLMCDNLETTMAELSGRGAEFEGGIQEEMYGKIAMLKVPGYGLMQLYEPLHPVAYNL